jgi:Tol biopolymer transport system component
MAGVVTLAACGGGGAPELASFAMRSDAAGAEMTPVRPVNYCCEGEPGRIATIFVNPRLDQSHPSQFGPSPQPDDRYLGVSVIDVTPAGALEFRWNGAFVADVHRDENAARALLPFDPDEDVGEIWTGRAGELEVSANHCDFLRVTFTIRVLEFSIVPAPIGGALPYRTHEQRVEIRNNCDPLPPPPPPTLRDRIVFSNTPPVGAPERDAEIWSLHQSTRELRQLTNNQQIADMDPVWSPDRSEIAFVSNRVSPAGGDFDLVVMEADGTNPEVVTSLDPLDRSADDPAWSPVPGERRIAFSQGRTGFGDNDLWILDLNEPEASPTRLRQLTTGANRDFSPTWSPDGASIAFVRTGAIYVVPASGGAPTLLFAPPDDNDAVLAIDWGPAGIVFDTYTFAVSRIRLARIDDSGGSRADVTSGGGHLADATPSWATTSASAVFDRQAEAAHRLFTVDIDDGGPNEAEEIAGQPDGENRDPDCGYGPLP